jgi:hypothetical protein
MKILSLDLNRSRHRDKLSQHGYLSTNYESCIASVKTTYIYFRQFSTAIHLQLCITNTNRLTSTIH